jgi:hypothetical protein
MKTWMLVLMMLATAARGEAYNLEALWGMTGEALGKELREPWGGPQYGMSKGNVSYAFNPSGVVARVKVAFDPEPDLATCIQALGDWVTEPLELDHFTRAGDTLTLRGMAGPANKVELYLGAAGSVLAAEFTLADLAKADAWRDANPHVGPAIASAAGRPVGELRKARNVSFVAGPDGTARTATLRLAKPLPRDAAELVARARTGVRFREHASATTDERVSWESLPGPIAEVHLHGNPVTHISWVFALP